MAQDKADELTDECGTPYAEETKSAKTRGIIYNDLLTQFGLPKEPESEVSCGGTIVTYNGAGDQPSHWFADNKRNRCKIVNYATEFSIYN